MPSIYVGDTGKKVKFRFTTNGTPDGSLVTSMRVKVRNPGSTNSTEWSIALVPGETTASLVTGEHMLSNGDVPRSGKYAVRAWLYVNGTAVADSVESFFQVERTNITPPE